jgi:hemerythrin-like domain-containing protein
MNTPETNTSRARALTYEHLVIREAMKRIESNIDRSAAESGNRARRWDLLSLVASFRDHLTRHFCLEDAEGILGAAARYYDAETRRHADGLVEEHRGFEARLERIHDRIGRAAREPTLPSKAAAEPYEEDLRGLLRDLARHERAEAKLLEQVILRESKGA